jgi:two-component system sensor histidine kinase CpxA
MRREPLELAGLVADIVEDVRLEAERRGVLLEAAVETPVTIAGDPELIRRAVENVLRNAVRYAPAETAVSVRVRPEPGRAVVEIRDSGPGVPEPDLPRIFEPFYRVHSDRDRASGGVGLGLAIARRAMELHRGSITAKNTQPGLQVCLQFPC